MSDELTKEELDAINDILGDGSDEFDVFIPKKETISEAPKEFIPKPKPLAMQQNPIRLPDMMPRRKGHCMLPQIVC